VWDSSFRITRFNHAFERLTGLNADEVISKPLDILFPDNSRDESTRLIENTLSGERWETVEIPILNADGLVRTVLWNSANIHDRDNKKVIATIAQGQDITERKKAEEALQKAHDELAKLVEERTRELSQKEVLLKEVHHRVKNNLQVISSLVNLQADGSRDETVREVLKDVTYRVRSMALVHEKLYQSSDLARIDFAEYSRGLLNYLWRAHGDATAAVQLKFKLEPLSLPIDIAVPCGLILNELAGNALKHAFRGRNEGEVTVSLHQTANGRICLRVRDNGVGLPSGFDWRQPSSLGLRLVQMLSKQIDAEVEVHQEEGTEFAVTLQVDRLEDDC
jgi:PAS domain S-box-containing protein